MDIREADPADVRTVSEIRQRRALDFPSADALLRLRARLDILMPVARVDTEIVGFALAALVTAEESRLGAVRYLFALVDEGPVSWAIMTALLSRLEQQCRAFDADEIQLSAEHAAGFLAQLEQSGDRSHGSGAASSLGAGPGPRLVKRLNAVRPIWGTSGSA
jgi:hypothetical protein